MSFLTNVLVLTCLVQLVIILYLFSTGTTQISTGENSKNALLATPSIACEKMKEIDTNIDGVAVVLFLHMPTWFQKRSTANLSIY